jgi:hypothetical protein
VQVDRQLIQDRRQQRLRELREEASDLLEAYAAGQKTVATVAAALDQWRAGVLQPDVADYFLNGPGRSTEPFQSLVQIAGASGGPQT